MTIEPSYVDCVPATTESVRESMKRIRYLSVEEVEWFHGRILDMFGGERGDLARANLEFTLERVKNVGEGLDRQYAIVAKETFLVHSLIVHHPLINGNKRTAFTVVESFLELNGYELRNGVQETYQFLADIGAGKISPVKLRTG